MAKDPLFLTFKSKTDKAIEYSEEKVQLSQRIMRIMDNAIERLSGKIDKYSEERKIIEATQADIAKSLEGKSSKKKHKEEIVLTPPETPVAEEPQIYCVCGQVPPFRSIDC